MSNVNIEDAGALMELPPLRHGKVAAAMPAGAGVKRNGART